MNNSFLKKPALFLVILSFVIAVTLLTYLGIRFPSDGVYYHALADNYLRYREMKDASMIPPAPVLTYQNGIVYFLVFAKYIFGDYWWLLYVLVVSLLWFVFVLKLHNTFEKIVSEDLNNKDKWLPWILCFVPLFHYDTVLIIGSFMNESILMPLLWLFFLKCFDLIRERLLSNSTIIYEHIKLSDIIILICIIFFGVLFRIQSIFFIMPMMFGLFLIRLISVRSLIISICIPIVILFFLKLNVNSPISETILSSLYINIFSFETYYKLLSIISSPISFISISAPREFLVGSPLQLILMLITATLFLIGLKNLWMISRTLSSLLLSVFFLNSIFLLTLPMHSSRYEHLLTVPLLIIFLYACKDAPFFFKKMRQVYVVMSALMIFILFSYISSYLNNLDRVTTMSKITSYKMLEKKVQGLNNFVIYSNEPRYPYWYFGLASCDHVPSECLRLKKLKASDNIYFIGKGLEIHENLYLHNYNIEANGQDLDNFNIWTVSKKESTIK